MTVKVFQVALCLLISALIGFIMSVVLFQAFIAFTYPLLMTQMQPMPEFTAMWYWIGAGIAILSIPFTWDLVK